MEPILLVGLIAVLAYLAVQLRSPATLVFLFIGIVILWMNEFGMMEPQHATGIFIVGYFVAFLGGAVLWKQ